LPVSLKGKPRAGSRQGSVKHRFCEEAENRDRREFSRWLSCPAAIAASGKICRDALGKNLHSRPIGRMETPAIPQKKLVHAGTVNS
jgi:hypothetical protein